jgi:hypothetical protein
MRSKPASPALPDQHLKEPDMSSLLTAQHIANAIAVLDAVSRLSHNHTPEELGSLNARAIMAAIELRVYSGLDKIKIEIKE